MHAGPPLVFVLRDARGGIIENLVEVVPATIPFYASLAHETRQTIAARLVDLVLGQLVAFSRDAIAAFGFETFSRRRQQGGRFGDLLGVLHLVRREFTKRVWESEADVHAIREVMLKLDDIFDVLIESCGPVFEHNLDEAQATLGVIESRYRSLYQKTPAMMHSIDAEGRIQAVSERWLQTLGYAADEVLGRRSTEFLSEESRKRAFEINIPRLRAEGQLLDVAYQFIKKNGTIIDVRLSSAVIRDERGEVSHFLAVFYDVTAELVAERELRESEERWRAVLELSPLPLGIHRAGVMIWANRSAAELLGADSPEGLIGLKVMDFVHPDDHAMVLSRIKESRKTQEQLPALEERIVRLDGKIVIAEVAARPITYKGEPATQLAFVDITARRAGEEARRISEKQAQIIEAQQEALRALSTPLIPIGDGVLVLPLVGRVNAERAERIITTLADGVVAMQARFAIVDVTGIPEADAEAVEALLRVTDVVRLLGAEAMITGIRPAIASTLVALGADLGRITTRSTLREGIVYATNKRRSGRV